MHQLRRLLIGLGCRVTWELAEDDAAQRPAVAAKAPQILSEGIVDLTRTLRASWDAPGGRAGQASEFGSGTVQSTTQQPHGGAEQQLCAEQDNGMTIKHTDEHELLSCLVVVPIGVEDPALGGWCNLN